MRCVDHFTAGTISITFLWWRYKYIVLWGYILHKFSQTYYQNCTCNCSMKSVSLLFSVVLATSSPCVSMVITVVTRRSGQRCLSQLRNMLLIAWANNCPRYAQGCQRLILGRLLSSGNDILIARCVHLILILLLTLLVHMNLKNKIPYFTAD